MKLISGKRERQTDRGRERQRETGTDVRHRSTVTLPAKITVIIRIQDSTWIYATNYSIELLYELGI